MNAHGIEIAALIAGDVVVVEDGLGYQEERVVTRVVDATGARGGIIDTKPVGSRRKNRTSGFRFGEQIVRVERMAR